MRRTLAVLLDWGGIVLTLALGIGAILVLQGHHAHRLFQLTLAWATMGLAWNIISGYAGQMSLGHQVFFGLGAYTTTLLMVLWHIPPWLGILASLLLGALAALIMGVLTFHLSGISFAMATLVYPLILERLMEYLGYQEVALPLMRTQPWLYWQFQPSSSYSWMFLALFMGSLLLSHRIEQSRFGYYLRAIKDNEHAAAAAGIDTWRYKMLAAVCSSLPAAALGGLFVHALMFVVTPADTFGLFVLVQTLIVGLLGGLDTKWGPLIGAALMISVREFLDTRWGDAYPGMPQLLFGVVLVLVTLWARQGIFWKVQALFSSPQLDHLPRVRRVSTVPTLAVPVPVVTPGPAEILLEVQDICKAFIGVQALQAVTFTVQRGEILGIIGPNGAGKTTLFNVLSGFLVPDHGRILLQGQDLTGLHPGAVCHRGVGRTFQVTRAFGRLSVLENVMVGAFAQQRSLPLAQRQARMALARVGLQHYAAWPIAGLNTFDLRLLELARCLATQPRLLLLDEPLAGLSGNDLEVMLPLLRRIRQQGITIVISEQTLHGLVRLSDRLVVLDHGEKVAEGTPDEVTRHPRVAAAYRGQDWLASE